MTVEQPKRPKLSDSQESTHDHRRAGVQEVATPLPAAEDLVRRAQEQIDRIDKANADITGDERQVARQETAVDERLARVHRDGLRMLQQYQERVQILLDCLDQAASEEQRERIIRSFGFPIEIGSGSFYRAYEDTLGDVVFKNLQLRYVFGEQEAVGMMARHAVEYERLRQAFGDEFIPATLFVLPEEFREEFERQKERFMTGEQKLYDILTFWKIQTDRRMRPDFKRRDTKQEHTGINKLFRAAGEYFEQNQMLRKKEAGAIVQERVDGITFQEFVDLGKERAKEHPQWRTIRATVRRFLQHAREFNQQYAMLWHRLDSDNIVLETDQRGEPTGRVRIIDLNFTERSFEWLRKLVNRKTERLYRMIEEFFDL